MVLFSEVAATVIVLCACLSWIAFEIRERRRVERAAETYRRQFELATHLKDEFLSTLSHELRTPANVILGFSDLLAHGELAPSEQIEAARAINRNAKAQSEMVNQLLDLSQIVSGQLSLKSEEISLHAIIKTVFESTHLSAVAKGLTFKIDLPNDDLLIYGDMRRIRQILWNLISNSIEFTPSGGTVTIQARRLSDEIEISVHDSGEGIEGRFIPFLFEKFRQQDGSKTRRHGGLGLGLSIVRYLTELHGGHARAASSGFGKGSHFYVTFPALNKKLYLAKQLVPQDSREISFSF